MTMNDLAARTATAALLLTIGLVGAMAARALGVPMPFLTGALAAVGTYSAVRTARGAAEQRFPAPVRKLFVALIGAMIGGSFTADLIGNLPAIWPSLLVMALFVPTALGAGYVIFRHGAGYDRVTAFYAAMPGGLVEAVALGEAAGGNIRLLTLQHFARVVIVVVTVPFLYLMWSGVTVGSLGGQSYHAGVWGWLDIVEFFGLALLGMWLGPYLRLPAAHLVGPLVLSALLHGSGLLHLSSPGWLLSLAQLVVGVGLGTSFAGTGPRELLRGFALGFVYVALVLGLGFAIAMGLAPYMPFGFDTLFVSFAPGGVTEMGLVALSLGISPVIVTAHHVFRIGLTVFVAGLIARRVQLTRE